MSNSITKTKYKFWKIFEKEVFEIIYYALDNLKKEKNLPNNEDKLNRLLLFKMRDANHYLLRFDSRRSDLTPIYQCTVQPLDDEDGEKKKCENKIPDFQFQKTDINSHTSSNSTKNITVECKRLGFPSSETWILNENYVKNGIQRFISEDWRYGQGSVIGAMIGYIQNMELEDIISEINNYISKNHIPSLNSDILNIKFLYEFHQLLNRSFEERNFKLRHIWIDLKDKYLK